ncbi:hypothetical protein IAQ61_005549 [Plenodomus lingam]|nr:hypothetical protein IAQ61_005549 [Plenodomus lingam]
MCPIKVVLVMALHTGMVQATSVDDLLQQTASRQDKTVQWAAPTRHALCAFSGNGGRLLLDTAANSRQLGTIPNEAANQAGITVHTTPHDLCRGTAQDMVNTPIQGVHERTSLGTRTERA